MRVYLEGVGLCGPGLDTWEKSRPILAGTKDYVAAPTNISSVALLPANERRRAVQIVKLALAVGAEAFAEAVRDPANTATVFASSGGDGDTIHEILNTLASTDRTLSPTRFHNSVHNAPAGYWSIATQSHAPSSVLCCYDDSFAAGLLEAAVQTIVGQQAVALLAYDIRYPSPLHEVRPMGPAFAVALLLAPEATPVALASMDLTLSPGVGRASSLESAELEAVRTSTPAARSLPLLATLAHAATATLQFDYLGDMAIKLAVTPVRHGSNIT